MTEQASPQALIEAARVARSPRLDLSRCGLSELPGAVRRLTHLESLDLQFKLRELSLPGEPDEELLAILRGLPHLRKLSLDSEDVDLG
jgi:hypothetical protein